MAKHEGADIDQYAMTLPLLLLLISILQHRQHLLVALDLVEVKFCLVKRLVHVHLLRHRGGSLQGKQAGLVFGHQPELPRHDASAQYVGG